MDPSLLDPSLPIAEFIRRCRQRLEVIEASVRELEAEREGLRRMVSAYGTLHGLGPGPVRVTRPTEGRRNTLQVFGGGGEPEPVSPANIGRHTFEISPATERSRNERMLSQVAILLLSGRRSTAELVELLERAGFPWTSSNPASLLSTLMSKDDRFESSRRLGWGLSQGGLEDPDEE